MLVALFRNNEAAFDSKNMGFAAALTVVLFIIIPTITVIQLRLTTRRID
jgi:ABC-type sugar transport system permease subunit